MSTTSRDIDSVSDEQILACLESVLAAPEFSASPQLSRFLRYVVENGLRGAEAELKESVIGVAVFNRGGSYDPKVDPIVRVEARRLRVRLDAYYLRTGAYDPIRISLPKGGYVPSFHATSARQIDDDVRVADFEVAAETPSETALAVAAMGKWRVARIFAGLILALAALVLVAGLRHQWRQPGAGSRFWSSMVADRPALLVPADSGLVMLQNLSKRSVSLQDYITGEYREHLAAQSPIDPDLVFNLGGRRYTSIADLEFASKLARRETGAHAVVIRYARDVRVEDLRDSNVVLLGARQSNPWVELFEKEATYRIEADENASTMRIVNLAPARGEPRSIPLSSAVMRDEIYGIVTYHTHENGSRAALIIAGTTVAGTEAAADFVLDDGQFEPWLRKVQTQTGFRGFDILLHGRNLAGAAPRAEVVSFHIQR